MMEHTMLPENNCPMLKSGLCKLSLTDPFETKSLQLQAEGKTMLRNIEEKELLLENATVLIEQLQAELDNAKESARCICGGKLSGIGYHKPSNTTIYECEECYSRLTIDSLVWERIIKQKPIIPPPDKNI